MGAEQFQSFGYGKTARDAFNEATYQARYDFGHAGYTGTIAEKNEFVEMALPEGVDPRKFSEWALDAHFIFRDQEPNPDQPWVQRALDCRAEIEELSISDLVKRASEIADDKWGPAVCVKVEPNQYLFFGWASC